MDLKDKISIFKKDGFENLIIVIDFDCTLTKGYNKDGSRVSVISILRNNDFISFDYQEKAKALFVKYHPIEIDPNISFEDKKDAMRKWWTEHFDLLAKSGVDKKLIEEISKREDLICLRDGFDDFFNFQKEYNIPTLIFSSAGVGDVIKLHLEYIDRLNKDIHIITNFWDYNDDGKFVGIKGKVIHGMNKGVDILRGSVFYEKYKNKKNIILLGDSMSDLNMVEGFNYENIITIGFFNQSNTNGFVKDQKSFDDMRDKYYDKFDIVIEGDGDMSKVNELLKKLV